MVLSPLGARDELRVNASDRFRREAFPRKNVDRAHNVATSEESVLVDVMFLAPEPKNVAYDDRSGHLDWRFTNRKTASSRSDFVSKRMFLVGVAVQHALLRLGGEIRGQGNAGYLPPQFPVNPVPRESTGFPSESTAAPQRMPPQKVDRGVDRWGTNSRIRLSVCVQSQSLFNRAAIRSHAPTIRIRVVSHGVPV